MHLLHNQVLSAFRPVKMKFVVFVILIIATMEAAADPLGPRVRRQDNSQCSNRSNLAEVLEEVGNLLSNTLDNLPVLNELNLTGKGNLLDLKDLLIALGDLLTDLLGTGLNGTTQPLIDLLDNLIGRLNTLLGGKQGSQWACKSSNSNVGLDVGNLVRGIHLYPGVPNLLIGLVRLLISLLSSILRGLGIPVPQNFGIPAIPNVG